MGQDPPPNLPYSSPSLPPPAPGPSPHYSWPSWPPREDPRGGARDDHHTSGDSIPVGCEASHLDTSQDSGLGAHNLLPRQAQAGGPGFYPGPEATFMPVEPPKDPPVRRHFTAVLLLPLDGLN